MPLRERSQFEQCVLASGLLTEAQLEEAFEKIAWTSEGEDETGPAHDEQLFADKLVRLGLLNAWQAKQMLEGRDDFHLGPYDIIDSLGRGGMGHVYLARHTVLGREVAVKVLPRNRSTPTAIENFTREIRAQASLSHENLVRAYDAGFDRNVYYLVSEYVKGADLRKLVRRTGPMDMQTAASIVSQVAKGVEHAHQQGIIHRDIKPGNVLVTPDGHAKLSDLGLAGSLVADPENDPQFGKIVGTADYLSPDHIRSPWAPTPAWDIYSLGCTLYFAVTSKVPFPGGSTTDKARAHCQVHPLEPRILNPSLSVEFVEVMADMMAKNPAERIGSATEVVERLAPWVGRPRPIPEASTGRITPTSKVFVSTGSVNDSTSLDDTQDLSPDEDDDPEEQWLDEHSQRSQTTHAVGATDDETRSDLSLGDIVSRSDEPRRIMLPMLFFVGLPVVLVGVLLFVLWVAGLVPTVQ